LDEEVAHVPERRTVGTQLPIDDDHGAAVNTEVPRDEVAVGES